MSTAAARAKPGAAGTPTARAAAAIAGAAVALTVAVSGCADVRAPAPPFATQAGRATAPQATSVAPEPASTSFLPPDDPAAGRTVLRRLSVTSANFPMTPATLVGSVLTVKIYCRAQTQVSVTFGKSWFEGTCLPGTAGATATFSLNGATDVSVRVSPSGEFWVVGFVLP